MTYILPLNGYVIDPIESFGTVGLKYIGVNETSKKSACYPKQPVVGQNWHFTYRAFDQLRLIMIISLRL